MRLERLKAFALSLPHTSLVRQWGDCYVFKVAGKMFMILVPDGTIVEGVVFKCTPEEFDELTEIDGIIQAPYCAKRMWAKVTDLAVLTEDQLNQRIRRSYDLVVAGLPKKTQAALGQRAPLPAASNQPSAKPGRKPAAATRARRSARKKR